MSNVVFSSRSSGRRAATSPNERRTGGRLPDPALLPGAGWEERSGWPQPYSLRSQACPTPETGTLLENTVPITAPNQPKNPQKHQQTRMSSPFPPNSNKTKALKMQSDPLQPAILLIDKKKKASAIAGAFSFCASNSFICRILAITPLFARF